MSFEHWILLIIKRGTKVQGMSPSWETNRFLASQEFPHILWKQKVHYHIHKSMPPVPLLSQISPVHAPSHFLNIHFNIILPSKPRSSKWFLFMKSPHQNPESPPLFPICAMCPTHLIHVDHLNNIWWALQIIQLIIMQFSPLPYYLFPIRPKYLPQYPILEHCQPAFLPEWERLSFITI